MHPLQKVIQTGLRLAITSRYLITGNTYKSLRYAFRVAHNTISLFVPEVYKAIRYSCPCIFDLPKHERGVLIPIVGPKLNVYCLNNYSEMQTFPTDNQ